MESLFQQYFYSFLFGFLFIFIWVLYRFMKTPSKHLREVHQTQNEQKCLWPENALKDEPPIPSKFDNRFPTLKLQLTSDTHLEFYCWEDTEWGKKEIAVWSESHHNKSVKERLLSATDFPLSSKLCEQFTKILQPGSECDGVALLGDIGLPLHPFQSYFYAQFLRWCGREWNHVFVICGNHEYYTNERISMEELHEAMVELCAHISSSFSSQVHFLHRNSFDLKGIRILGCTLWTEIPHNEEHYFSIWRRVNDYNSIYKNVEENSGESQHLKDDGSGNSEERQKTTRELQPQDTRLFHYEEVEWLEKEVTQLQRENPNIPCVIFTHHSPVPSAEKNVKFLEDPASFVSATDLRRFFHDPVYVWAYGHTHQKYEKRHGTTRVVTNASGYEYDRVEGYDSQFILTI
jgi:hypothetical protein